MKKLPSSISKKRFFDLEELYKKNEYTVFDAIRDNKGKGIKVKDLIKILEKTT